MEVAAWAPCKLILDTQRKKPKWAYVVVADATGELKEGMSVILYFRQQDGSVIVAAGEIVRVMKDGTAKIRVPWFAAASLAAWAGVNIGEASGKVELYNCAVYLEILEEAEERGWGVRVKQVAEEE